MNLNSLSTRSLIAILFLINLPALLSSCKKNDNSPTSRMGGLRKWKGYYHYHMHPPPSVGPADDYTNNMNDTTFALTIPGGDMISVFGHTLPLDKASSKTDTLYFGLTGDFKLIYFSSKDSMVYIESENFSVYGGSELVYYTYK